MSKQSESLAKLDALKGVVGKSLTQEELKEAIRLSLADGSIQLLTPGAFKKRPDLLDFAKEYGLLKLPRGASGNGTKGTARFVREMYPTEYAALEAALKPFENAITFPLPGGGSKTVVFQPYWREVTNGVAGADEPASATAGSVDV